MINLEQLLKSCIAHEASDLHIVVGSEVRIRKNGVLQILDTPVIDNKTIKNICIPLLNETQQNILQNKFEVDLALSFDGIGRFRLNLYQSLGNLSATFRVIPYKIPNLESLFLPQTVELLLKKRQGLILVTGSTGSGKSTTLAAMIDYINTNYAYHIITIEDPVEFIHSHKKSLISHRDLFKDTSNYQQAIKMALRQDPDVILIGELRDKETIQSALIAAQTGHLVLATLHTQSADLAIQRVIQSFDVDQQPFIANQLASILEGVISQNLINTTDNKRIGVYELLVAHDGIKNLIRKEEYHQIYAQMEVGGKEYGMQTQTKSLIKLIEKKRITKEEALKIAIKHKEFQRMLKEKMI